MRIGGLSLRTTSSPIVEERWAVTLYAFIDGCSHHAAMQDDFAIPHRDDLLSSLADLSAAWTEGPYGEPARQLVDRQAARLDNRFARYDNLAGAGAGQPERMVLTHGEPHAANTINTDAEP